jgi:hypothetical protein
MLIDPIGKGQVMVEKTTSTVKLEIPFNILINAISELRLEELDD